MCWLVSDGALWPIPRAENGAHPDQKRTEEGISKENWEAFAEDEEKDVLRETTNFLRSGQRWALPSASGAGKHRTERKTETQRQRQGQTDAVTSRRLSNSLFSLLWVKLHFLCGGSERFPCICGGICYSFWPSGILSLLLIVWGSSPPYESWKEAQLPPTLCWKCQCSWSKLSQGDSSTPEPQRPQGTWVWRTWSQKSLAQQCQSRPVFTGSEERAAAAGAQQHSLAVPTPHSKVWCLALLLAGSTSDPPSFPPILYPSLYPFNSSFLA